MKTANADLGVDWRAFLPQFSPCLQSSEILEGHFMTPGPLFDQTRTAAALCPPTRRRGKRELRAAVTHEVTRYQSGRGRLQSSTFMEISMKRFGISTCALALAVAATLSSGGIVFAQGSRHATPGGASCITFTGITHDQASDYNFANWENQCDDDYTVEYTRIEPISGQYRTDRRTVPNHGSVSALILKSTSITEWHEVM
jgi:hypothetical protein